MNAKHRVLPLISRDVRVEFDLSASDNLIVPSFSRLLPVLSENEMSTGLSGKMLS
jgi:hypothetical protein